MADHSHGSPKPKELNYLSSGTFIDDYIIERLLAQGGFSSVYLARHVLDQHQVLIKEYLPRQFAYRTWNNTIMARSEAAEPLFRRGRVLFFEEAKVLAQLKHPNIVDVINLFRTNATVYMVMTYEYGITLEKWLQTRTPPVTVARVLQLFLSLLAGVDYLHRRSFVHLDIKPANILIRPRFDALLFDFGAIQSFPQNRLKKQNHILTKGYSPPEQYQSDGVIGPWSDIYAVGATLRACLALQTPLSAEQRIEHDRLVPAATALKGKFPDFILKTADAAMALAPQDRPQSISDLKKMLQAV
jgi:serine/threonine protein kinase